MPEADERGPERTCVACRRGAPRDDLLRLVAAPDGELVVDLRARLPGRGAWVHPDATCVAQLEARPGALRRALRVDVDTGGLSERVREAVERALLDGLSQASAGGALIGGHDRLVGALLEGRVVWVAVADDAAARTVRSVEEAAAGEVPLTTLPLGREALGRQVGQAPRAAVGVRPSSASAHLLRQLRRWRNLG